jgi:hypothetical protein
MGAGHTALFQHGIYDMIRCWGRHGEEVDKIMSGRIKCHKETHTKKKQGQEGDWKEETRVAWLV